MVLLTRLALLHLYDPCGGGGRVYNGIFSFWNAIVQPFANLIYFAVVQATNSHQLAWLLTTVPFCTISFLLMLFVDFEKASADAGRKKDAVASSTTAA